MTITIRILAIALTLTISGLAYAAPAKPARVASSTDVHVATCKDGKEYYAPTNEHRGACSGHGGVASWADGSLVRSSAKSNRYR
jgi:hypothetical protein